MNHYFSQTALISVLQALASTAKLNCTYSNVVTMTYTSFVNSKQHKRSRYAINISFTIKTEIPTDQERRRKKRRRRRMKRKRRRVPRRSSACLWSICVFTSCWRCAIFSMDMTSLFVGMIISGDWFY